MTKIYCRRSIIVAFCVISSMAYGTGKPDLPTTLASNSLPKLEVGGRINLDADHFEGIYIDPADNQTKTQKKSELRRARLFIKFSLNDNWSSKLQIAIDGNDDNYQLKDAYIRYKGFNFADIKIGQIKESFGLENVTSSANTLFVERSPLSSFSLGRSKGINIANSARNYSWSLGAYKVEENSNIKADGDNAYTTRATYSPINDGNTYTHLAASYSKRNLAGAEYELKSNGGINSATNFLDTRNIATDSLEQAGIEGAWGRGALSFQAEYQHLKINGVDSEEDTSYQGHYAQLSYFLTPDHRPYKKGRFAGVKPLSSSGAWELALRYGTLQSIDIGNSDENVAIEVVTTTLGINYYLNKRIKIMLNATDSDTNGIALMGLSSTGKALSMRIQLKL